MTEAKKLNAWVHPIKRLLAWPATFSLFLSEVGSLPTTETARSKDEEVNRRMKPNLFNLATKELSQDAFLAWLLQWADPCCSDHNEELQAVAESFLRELISLQSEVPSSIDRVKAGRQWENVDVWAEVNTSHLVIIEDKVGTGQHSDQLSRYRAIGEKWCQERGYQLVCVYVKTHSDSALNLAHVEKQGFSVLNRKRLLELLNAHEVRSDIYNDFRDRLKELERRESNFDKKKISDWNGNCLLYTSPSPRDQRGSRMPSSA